MFSVGQSLIFFSLFQLSPEVMVPNLFRDILSGLSIFYLYERIGLYLNIALRVGSNHFLLFLSYLLQVQKLA